MTFTALARDPATPDAVLQAALSGRTSGPLDQWIRDQFARAHNMENAK